MATAVTIVLVIILVAIRAFILLSACTDWRQIDDSNVDALVLTRMFKRAHAYTDARCFMSPISPQSMMIFGALSSAWRIL